MPSNSAPSSVERQDPARPKLPNLSSRAWMPSWITRTFSLFPLALILLVIRSWVVPQPATPTDRLTAFSSSSVERNVQYQASLIRENLPAYLYFVGTRVLPIMSKNIDDILHNLNGLTDIRPGLFYHGHIDYSVSISGGIDGLMEMNNVILQYHTLENPLIYIPYWRMELANIHDPNINAWLEKINEYNRTISTPSVTSGVQYTPLTKNEAVNIAARWDTYRRQNKLPSPGVDLLTDMVYLIDGGKQLHYQEAFKTMYRFHSIAFGPAGYLLLDNRTHLENTFSPLQITFELIGACNELLPVFEEANAARLGYILNLNNVYVAQHPEWLQGDTGPEMAKLSMTLNQAIRILPDDNLIKISNTPKDQQIAFFAIGNYIFAVSGSLDSPSVFK